MRFTIRDLLWLTVVVAVALTAFFAKPRSPGRYQMTRSDDGLILLDTATSQCWERDRYGTWTNRPTPAFPAK